MSSSSFMLRYSNLILGDRKGKKQGVSCVCCIFYFAHKDRKDNLKSNAAETGVDWGHRGEGEGMGGEEGGETAVGL